MIDILWQEFSRAVMPRTAGDVQRQEMRRAFYAGVEGMMKVLHEIGEDDISEEAGCQILDAIKAELLEFSKKISDGKA